MTIAFTGLACGHPVELTFLVVGRVQFDENFMGPIGGTYTVIRSGGSDARGHGEFTGAAGIGGSYQGQGGLRLTSCSGRGAQPAARRKLISAADV